MMTPEPPAMAYWRDGEPLELVPGLCFSLVGRRYTLFVLERVDYEKRRIAARPRLGGRLRWFQYDTFLHLANVRYYPSPLERLSRVPLDDALSLEQMRSERRKRHVRA